MKYDIWADNITDNDKGLKNRNTFMRKVPSILFLDITLQYFSNSNTDLLMLLWSISIISIFTVVAPQASECRHCLRGMTVGLSMM
jgi:hypothetical protein